MNIESKLPSSNEVFLDPETALEEVRQALSEAFCRGQYSTFCDTKGNGWLAEVRLSEGSVVVPYVLNDYMTPTGVFVRDGEWVAEQAELF